MISVTKRIPLPLLPRSVRWAGVLTVAAIIFYGSLVTVPDTIVDDAQPGLVELHHWRHITAYFALACSVAYATDHWELPRWSHTLVVIGIATLYGIGMELGQSFVPYRTDFLISDVMINAVGASGVLLWFVVRPHLEMRPVSAFGRGLG